ncbi:hypothetical protein [Cohnella sp. AR92]|uniref:hypothetical protein n=1 Tax=Cohnella sp. AR92 TaxID=648716 RepID=UPI000F8F750C|nr:hypothetical protein [Cohnella sp. AR92]RUS46248.1 hypothetical protein ELR57_14315 [Cohnella sp. AR92]
MSRYLMSKERLMPNAVFNPIESICGHFAGRGINKADNKFIDGNLKNLLAQKQQKQRIDRQIL